MSFTKRKNLISFGMIDGKVSPLDKDTMKHILERYPSILASVYRRTNQKSKAIQALQCKILGHEKAIYSHEILYNYIYFEDYDGALERAKYLGFRDEAIERVLLQIFIHKKTQVENVCCGTDTYDEINDRIFEYLSTYFSIDVLGYFIKALKDFCNNNKECKDKSCGDQKISLFRARCTKSYLGKLGTESLKYIYHELGVAEALRLIVHRNPKINECYFREFVEKCFPNNKEIKSILKRIYIPCLFELLEKRNSLTKDIKKVKEYYNKGSASEEVKLESRYCKKANMEEESTYLKVCDTSNKKR
ncbi:hypothetical protein EHEL_051540 [Encephalitozoon hellem ATCC 50504]|uniref:Cullin-3 n=1 Tax=Encephalitozoon hellem TaxID=27973 RepID=A0A9Q9CAC6_ENCHE|nr:uncharacterized protein EHEL_051540 [Encephalitozoon hellem ATCC 50504]AFM98362.1 hypothetical protein EHEL_051540 [Encephalitozoon hellem ATCC 50504]UTX43243.1 cullin-3 [Encephalitozoon hellem]WEL38701.1 cullin-3 [Encephalitozoon hellem]|eukprot:XP_003887343.1 hypothetical protein EHEL_051540 [Encephalitozoon hellem ATCC 50504]